MEDLYIPGRNERDVYKGYHTIKYTVEGTALTHSLHTVAHVHCTYTHMYCMSISCPVRLWLDCAFVVYHVS